MSRLYKKACVICGTEFESIRSYALVCSNKRCKMKYKYAYQKEQKRVKDEEAKKKSKTQELIKAAKQAQEAGLSYGEWQAMQYMARLEELERLEDDDNSRSSEETSHDGR